MDQQSLGVLDFCYVPGFWFSYRCLEEVRLNNKVQRFAIVFSLLIGIQATQ